MGESFVYLEKKVEGKKVKIGLFVWEKVLCLEKKTGE